MLNHGAVQALSLFTFMADMGVQVTCTMHTNVKAAIGIARRVGLRKLRHLNVRYFWFNTSYIALSRRFSKCMGWRTQQILVTKLINHHLVTKHMRIVDMRSDGEQSGKRADA